MKKNTIIRCRNREEMNRIANLLTEQGISAETEEKMLPFQPYGICLPVYRVKVYREASSSVSGFPHSFISISLRSGLNGLCSHFLHLRSRSVLLQKNV